MAICYRAATALARVCLNEAKPMKSLYKLSVTANVINFGGFALQNMYKN